MTEETREALIALAAEGPPPAFPLIVTERVALRRLEDPHGHIRLSCSTCGAHRVVRHLDEAGACEVCESVNWRLV
jgi:hypothetical protein